MSDTKTTELLKKDKQVLIDRLCALRDEVNALNLGNVAYAIGEAITMVKRRKPKS